MRRTPYVSYDQSSQWYRLPAIQDSILSSLTTIDDLVEPATVKKIISEHNSGNERTRSLAFLLTMIHWKKVLQEK